MTTTNATYQLGMMAAFGTLTQRGWAPPHIVADNYGRYEFSADTCLYYHDLAAVILKPDVSLLPSLLDDATITGSVGLCCPGAYQVPHYWAYNVTPNHLTQIASRVLLPATPSFVCSVFRCPSPHGMAPTYQHWSLYFGGGWELRFGGDEVPRLFHNDVEFARYHIQPHELEAYLTKEHFRIEIHNFGDKLRITGFRGDAWVVEGVGQLPAATWAFTGAGGAYALNVTPVRYATSGYFETGWIEHGSAYAAGDMTPRVLPTPQAGCTVTVAIVEESGTRKRYRVTLTGPGTTTPRVGLWAAEYPSAVDAPADTPVDISDYMQHATYTRTRAFDNTQVTGTATLQSEIGGQTLHELLGGPIRGQRSLYMAAGLAGGVQLPMFTGILTDATIDNDADGKAVVNLRAVDAWKLLDDAKLIMAPTGLGLSLSDAIAKWCRHAGLPDALIDMSLVMGDLTDPDDGYDKPPYTPENGQALGAWLRDLMKAFGVKLYFEADGVFTGAMSFSTANVADYTTAAGASLASALTSIQISGDTAGIENGVIVEGVGLDGQPIFAERWDTASIYDPNYARYVGYPAPRYIRDANIHTQAGANVRCANEFRLLNRGQRAVTMTAREPACTLPLRVPWERIRVTDAYANITLLPCEIESVTVEDDGEVIVAQAVASEVVA